MNKKPIVYSALITGVLIFIALNFDSVISIIRRFSLLIGSLYIYVFFKL